jgi:hypothetical protein
MDELRLRSTSVKTILLTENVAGIFRARHGGGN